jgi:hypothetical protein
MEMKKGDSRMDVAALTRSGYNYFDTQYEFIRHLQNNNETHLPTHSDNTSFPLATSTSRNKSTNGSNNNNIQEQEPEQEQQDENGAVEGAQTGPPKCPLTYCCICTNGLPPSFQNPPTWYV